MQSARSELGPLRSLSRQYPRGLNRGSSGKRGDLRLAQPAATTRDWLEPRSTLKGQPGPPSGTAPTRVLPTEMTAKLLPVFALRYSEPRCELPLQWKAQIVPLCWLDTRCCMAPHGAPHQARADPNARIRGGLMKFGPGAQVSPKLPSDLLASVVFRRICSDLCHRLAR